MTESVSHIEPSGMPPVRRPLLARRWVTIPGVGLVLAFTLSWTGLMFWGALVIGLGLAAPTEFAFRMGLETYWSRVQSAAEDPPWWIEEHLPLKGRWLRAFLYAPGTLLLIFGIWVGAMAMIAVPLFILLAAFASVFGR